ncbi:hypothetical protein [Paenibacillus spongiae]|uniref:Glycoside hydrolase 123 C-terminal domain-containing protein n=1 Tax=Paenibacillus spongiae TaxID=2909671 RepID=A0ABY5S0D8_9BACL|nr:hypothetical protein [Paenibacillus spongiae]UVI27309.1 hypothetical protein L1F29_17660 [Paenibacillus spongiae]
MRKRLMMGIIMLCALLMVVSPVMANTATRATDASPRQDELAGQISELDSLIGTAGEPQMKQYLEDVRIQANALPGSSAATSKDGLVTMKAVKYALKLAKDARKGSSEGLWAGSPFVVYDVPALSPIKRLPDMLPDDGTISDRLSIISAQDEYEAASFVLAPLRDVGAVTFTPSELQGEGGVIPASAVDMHVVKTWYQGGTAWQSYFGDPSQNVLVPELLLHDENLVLVDHERKGNSLRVDYPEGSRYVDISNIPATKFDRFAEPVEDSKTLLPVALKQGESKQMWLTLKVPPGTPAGFYTGTIAITADGVPAGQITLKIRVLPFELPDPKTYYDLDKDFYVMLYHGSRLKEYLAAAKGDTAFVEAKLLNEYRNLVEHNVLNLPGPLLYSNRDKATFLRQLELMQQAGLDLDPLFGVKQTYPDYSIFVQYSNYLNAKKAYEANPTEENKQKMDNFYKAWRKGVEDFLPTLDEAYNVATSFLGHSNIYFDGWDEAGWSMLQFEQEIWKYVQEKLGAKVFATGNGSHLDLEVKENFLNWAGEPTREKAAQWHAFGDDKIITNYALPHTGPENPDLIRQRHGMWVYKANFDATYNYIFYENPNNIWNDNPSVGFPYRAFNLVYPTKTDLIDTIAWEGYREGIDDIRYATKLKQVAADAIASGVQERVEGANAALNWLEAVDERSTNQDLLRLEMIRHIVRLLDLAQ